MNKWIWGGVLVVVALGIYLFTGSPASQPNTVANAPANNTYTATGNPDDIVDAYLQAALIEQASLNSEVAGASLNSDSSALDGLGQTYDETKL